MALLDDDSATELFKRMKLDSKELEALDKKLAEHGDEPRHAARTHAPRAYKA